jgi:hypothetical protein
MSVGMTEREGQIMEIIAREVEKYRQASVESDNSNTLILNAQIMGAIQTLLMTINKEVFEV